MMTRKRTSLAAGVLPAHPRLFPRRTLRPALAPPTRHPPPPVDPLLSARLRGWAALQPSHVRIVPALVRRQQPAHPSPARQIRGSVKRTVYVADGAAGQDHRLDHVNHVLLAAAASALVFQARVC